MKKIVRLTESDLIRIVKRVISEQPVVRTGYKHTPENTNDEQIATKMKRLSELGIKKWGVRGLEIVKATPKALDAPHLGIWQLDDKSGYYIYFDCTRKNGGRQNDGTGKDGYGFKQFTPEEGDKLYNIFCKVL